MKSSAKTKHLIYKSIAQYLGKGAPGKKMDARQRKFFESKHATLRKYQGILESSEAVKRHLIKPKTTRLGLGKTNVIFYNDSNELTDKPLELNTTKQVGNTGVNNDINAILDKLLKIECIDKTIYDKMFKNIFFV